MKDKRSPGLEALKCEVCDRPGELLEWLGVTAHRGCFPGHWRKDRAERDDYMAAVVDWMQRRLKPAPGAR